jgi:hypothetical protein
MILNENNHSYPNGNRTSERKEVMELLTEIHDIDKN